VLRGLSLPNDLTHVGNASQHDLRGVLGLRLVASLALSSGSGIGEVRRRGQANFKVLAV